MIVRIRLSLPFGSNPERESLTGTTSPATVVLPPIAFVSNPAARPEPSPGESLLRLNNHLAAYEPTTPVNVTVHESVVSNLAPPDSANQ